MTYFKSVSQQFKYNKELYGPILKHVPKKFWYTTLAVTGGCVGAGVGAAVVLPVAGVAAVLTGFGAYMISTATANVLMAPYIRKTLQDTTVAYAEELEKNHVFSTLISGQ